MKRHRASGGKFLPGSDASRRLGARRLGTWGRGWRVACRVGNLLAHDRSCLPFRGQRVAHPTKERHALRMTAIARGARAVGGAPVPPTNATRRDRSPAAQKYAHLRAEGATRDLRAADVGAPAGKRVICAQNSGRGRAAARGAGVEAFAPKARRDFFAQSPPDGPERPDGPAGRKTVVLTWLGRFSTARCGPMRARRARIGPERARFVRVGALVRGCGSTKRGRPADISDK